jgi:hypothetical protein
MTIPVPQRINNKLTEEFYPLQREELIKLREVKLINNAAYVHLALRYENPFCDRPVQIIPKEFALRWRIPEVSVYKAIAKLKELGILNIKSGKLVIDWVIKSENQVLKDTASHNTETATEDVAVNDFSNSTENYQIEEKIIRSDNLLSNPKTDYQIRENHGLKPLSDIGSNISQTLQTIQTNQTRGGQEKVFSSNQESNKQEIVQEQEINEDKKLVTKNESVEQSIRDVVQKKAEIITPRIKPSDTSKSSADIPNDLREKLEGLEIPLDDQVRSAIASHDISQAYGAAAHVENTWDTINNPRSVFLYQLPKQPIEKLGSRYSEEILNNMKAQNQAIEEERSDPEYYEKSKNAFAQIRAKLKGKRAQ